MQSRMLSRAAPSARSPGVWRSRQASTKVHALDEWQDRGEKVESPWRNKPTRVGVDTPSRVGADAPSRVGADRPSRGGGRLKQEEEGDGGRGRTSGTGPSQGPDEGQGFQRRERPGQSNVWYGSAARGGRGGRGVEDPQAQDRIAFCNSIEDLSDLIRKEGKSFKSLNLGTAAVRAYHLCTPSAPQPAQAVVEKLAGLVSKQKPGFMQPMHTSNILWALAKLGSTPPEGSIESLLDQAYTSIDQFNPLDIASTCWALDKLNYHDPLFVSALTSNMAPLLMTFTAKDLATTYIALAGLNANVSDFPDFYLRAARSKLPGFSPNELTNTLDAMTTLGLHEAVFMDAFVNRAMPRLSKFSPLNLTTTLSAMAKVGTSIQWVDAEMVRAIIAQIRPKPNQLKPKQLGSTLQALACFKDLGVSDEGFAIQILGRTSQQLTKLNHEGLSSTLWAVAKLGLGGDPFIQRLARAVASKVRNLQPEQLALSLSALAELSTRTVGGNVENANGGEEHKGTGEESKGIDEESKDINEESKGIDEEGKGTERGEGNIISGKSEATSEADTPGVLALGEGCSHLLSVLVEEATYPAKLAVFTPSDIAITLSSLAKLGGDHSALVSCLVNQSKQQLSRFTPSEEAEVTRSLSEMKWEGADLFKDISLGVGGE